jgi:intein/homing endonuclease
MDIINLSYLAGFFDGEGSINIITRKRRINPEYTLSVAIGQKDGKTLDWIRENFGGNVYLVKRDGSFFWIITNQQALKFLLMIYPYLQYKKPQAELAIKFYDDRQEKRMRTNSKEEMERRESIRQQLRQLHHTILKSQYAGSTTKRINPKGM